MALNSIFTRFTQVREDAYHSSGKCFRFSLRKKEGTKSHGTSVRRCCSKAVSKYNENGTQLTAITPRWLVQLLNWVPVESGTYRVNKVKDDPKIEVSCGSRDERTLPETFVDYEETPREYTLSAITTVVDVHTRVSDLFSHPHDQIREQLRLTVEKVKERQESELINNADYGLLQQCRSCDSRSMWRQGCAHPRRSG